MRHIGWNNVLCISGGQYLFDDASNTVIFPVGNGYKVIVTYHPVPDTYTVKREFHRAGKIFPKGTVEYVYAPQLGQIAYDASLYSTPFGQEVYQ
jgi:hypothetical protein